MQNSSSSSSKLSKTAGNDLHEMADLSKNNKEKNITHLPIDVLAMIFQYLSVKDQRALAQTSKLNRSVLPQFTHLWISGLANSNDSMIKRALTLNPNIQQMNEGQVTALPLLTLAKKHRNLLEYRRVDLTKIEHQQTFQAYTRKLFPLIKGSWEQAEGAIISMVKLPGNRIAVTSRDHGTVKILDSFSGALVHTLTPQWYGYGHKVTVLKALPSGQNGHGFVASGTPRTLDIWNLQTGKPTHSFIWCGETFQILSAGPNGEVLIASAQAAGQIKILDPGAAHPFGTSNHYDFSPPIRTLNANMNGFALHAFSSGEDDRPWLANGTLDNAIKIWDPLTGALIHTLHGHSGLVICLKDVFFLEEGKVQLASGSRDNNIKIWDPQTGAHIHTLQGHTGWVKALEVLPLGLNGEPLLASGSLDSSIRIWNIKTGECLTTIQTEAPVWSLLYDAGVLRAGLENGRIVSIHPKGVDLDAVLGADNSSARGVRRI